MILAYCNHKGGTGKTTSTVSTAACMARVGKRVLVVDLDAQCSAGLALGVNSHGTNVDGATITEALQGAPAADAILHTDSGVDIITASYTLADMDVRMASMPARDRLLKRTLAPVRDRYDIILLDCAPSLSLLTVNALVAADAVVIPLQPQYLAMHGINGVMQAVENVRKGTGSPVQVLGIALVACDYRQAVTRESVAMVRQHFGRQVFRTEIRQSVKLVEAPSHGKPITHYAPSSPAAVQYEALTGEILHRIKRMKP